MEHQAVPHCDDIRRSVEIITDDRMAELEDMQKALRQALPAQPNEVLTYSCTLKPAAKPKE